MKGLTRMALATVVLASMVSGARAQSKSPDFSGEWRPDGSQKPTETLSIKQDATQLTVKDSSSTLIFKLDGSPTQYNLNGTVAPAGTKPDDAPEKTTAKWSGATLTLTLDASNGDRPFTIVDVYELGKGGKTLTRNRTTAIADQGKDGVTKETTTHVR